MTEYWVSQARHWCEYCKIYINGSKPSIAYHENGRKHKEAVEFFLREMRKRGRERRAEQHELNAELAKIERSAKAAFEQQDGGGGARLGTAAAPAAGDRATRLAELEHTIHAAKLLQRGDASRALPPGWRMRSNPDGKVYYVNESTGEVTWEKPASEALTSQAAGATSGDHEAACDTNACIASSCASSDTPLLEGWQRGYNESGVPYFYNVSLGVTQWEMPTLEGAGSKGTEGGEAKRADKTASDAKDAQAESEAESNAEVVQARGVDVRGSGTETSAADSELERPASDPALADEPAALEELVAAAEEQSTLEAANPEDGGPNIQTSADVEGQIDTATGFGSWTVVEPPTEGSSSTRQPRQKKPRFARGDEDEEEAQEVFDTLKAHYPVPEELLAATEAAKSAEAARRAAAPVEVVQFNKRRNKGSFRKKIGL